MPFRPHTGKGVSLTGVFAAAATVVIALTTTPSASAAIIEWRASGQIESLSAGVTTPLFQVGTPWEVWFSVDTAQPKLCRSPLTGSNGGYYQHGPGGMTVGDYTFDLLGPGPTMEVSIEGECFLPANGRIIVRFLQGQVRPTSSSPTYLSALYMELVVPGGIGGLPVSFAPDTIVPFLLGFQTSLLAAARGSGPITATQVPEPSALALVAAGAAWALRRRRENLPVI